MIAKPSADVIVFVVRSDHPHRAQKRLPVCLQSRDDERVPERIELIPPIIHHSREILINLLRVSRHSIVLAKVLRGP